MPHARNVFRLGSRITGRVRGRFPVATHICIPPYNKFFLFLDFGINGLFKNRPIFDALSFLNSVFNGRHHRAFRLLPPPMRRRLRRRKGG